MRIISVNSVTGNEVLARDIRNKNDFVLITAGTVMKKEYVNRLKDLNIEYIYVEDEIAKDIKLMDSLELQIKEHCQESVKEILNKYSYQDTSELEEIKTIADEIIFDILEEPEVIYNLSSIRNKNESTYSHSLNVCALSVIIALKLKIPKIKIREIAIGCLLHDIGFTYYVNDYQNIDITTCSDNERKEIMRHIIYGYSALEKMDWLSNVAKNIVLSHHERLDGSGYPFHLKEDRIKIGSKIVAVCDEFDSRVYGNFLPKMKVHEAIEYIVSQAGILFDCNIVKAFVDSVAAYPIGSMVITNKDEIGIVLRQNLKYPTRPILRIIKDKSGKKPTEFNIIDLKDEFTTSIVDTIMDY